MGVTERFHLFLQENEGKMKSKAKKSGFSIIELLTVMSIIIILLGILVPSLGAVRRYARVVRQKGYFHEISKGLESFSVDFDGYPDSSPGDFDPSPDHYCGAMKLCEAMIGQDKLGFHPDSVFDDKGQANLGAGLVDLYFNRPPGLTDPPTDPEKHNLRERKPLYIEGEDVQIAEVNDIFPSQSDFDDDCPFLCDVFKRNHLRVGKEKAGMPILYYKADPSKLLHDIGELTGKYNSGQNIYNYYDNIELIEERQPWPGGEIHPYEDPPAPKVPGQLFYENTIDKSVLTMDKPHNPDSYILISAGWDGLYGTRDDVFNFD